jgi:hypothetical protein
MEISAGAREFVGEIAKPPRKTSASELPMRDLYHAQLSLTAKSNHPRAEELAVMTATVNVL